MNLFGLEKGPQINRASSAAAAAASSSSLSTKQNAESLPPSFNSIYRLIPSSGADIPIDTLVNTSLAVEDFDDNGGDDESDSMDLTGNIGDFKVNDTSNIDGVALPEMFIDDKDDGEVDDEAMAVP